MYSRARGLSPAAAILSLTVVQGCAYTIDFPSGEGAGCEDTAWRADPDGDGYYGDRAEPLCPGDPAGTDQPGDCQPELGEVSPDREEIWYNGLDDDCDTATPDDDLDGDGYPIGTDCQDNDAAVNPGVEQEICGNGVDDDCDGSGNGCTLRGVVGLEEAGAKLLGEGPGDGAGGSGAWVGDVNCDGLNDLLIGAPSWDSAAGGDDLGAAYLFYGLPDGFTSLSEADARLEGTAAGQTLSGLIAGLGDIDGDGCAELLLGSRAESTGSLASDGTAAVGSAFLVRGGALAGALALEAGTPGVSVIKNSAATGEYLGQAAAGPLDFDGDGVGDIAIGVWRVLEGREQDGAAYIFSGDGLQDTDLSEASWRFNGVDSSGSEQLALGVLGDIDGDGMHELAVGSSRADVLDEDAGAVYLIGGGRPPGDYQLSSADHVLVGEAGGDGVGSSVAGAGDVNGDGYGDLLIGAWEQAPQRDDTRLDEAGAAYLIYGPLDALEPELRLGTLGARFLGYQSGLRAGRPVGSAGDINGDGLGDVVIGGGLVGAGEALESRAFVISGPVPPGTWWLDTSDPELAIATLREEQPGDWGGAVIVGVGDISGDGLGDLLVGAPNESTLDEYAGAAYLFVASGI